jgi:CrcB protein
VAAGLNQALLQAAAVGAGGFLGALLRYAVSVGVNRAAQAHWLPWGTLVVNLLGCLLIGVVAALADARGGLGAPARLFLVVGLLGGFTTYSAFAYETLWLLRERSTPEALVYVGLHLLLGLLLVWAGWRLGGGR